MATSSRRPVLVAVVGVLALAGALLVPVLRPAPEGRLALDAEQAAQVRRQLWESERSELEAPADAMLARQLFGSDAAPHEVFARAVAQAQELGERSEAADPALAGLEWELVGPTNVGGRILDIAVDPELDDVVYAAAASGGVWRSDDGGMTYREAWPRELTQAIGALAMTPDGTLFAGTGETGPGGGSMTYGGTGVYRSSDRGETWERVGLGASSRIGRIVVHPADPDTIYVAASGPLFNPGGERGLYRSTDGGDTWELILEGDNATTGAVDLAIDPADPDKMFAALWDHQRTPDRRRYNGPGSGLYVTTDAGETWARVPGLFGPNPAMGRIGVAIAPSDPDVVYVTASGESGAYAGAYKSTDGGTTWIPITHPLVVANNVVYGWWFGRLWVDPLDPDVVYQAGLDMVVSRDGGVNWSTISGLHADQHAMAWDPKAPGRVYLGNDGGMYVSENNGRSFLFAEYQPWSQLYGLDVSEQDPNDQVAGLQDNGVNRSFANGGEDRGADGWNSYGGGDGERTLIDPADPKVVYGCSQYGSCFRSDNWGPSQKDSFGDRVVSTRKNWFTPIEFDPEDSRTIYSGGEIMSRSTDQGRTWTIISPDLSNGPGRETNPLFINFGTLTTIAPAGRSTGTIYAGTDDGNLWFTHDDGATWTKASDPDLPTAWVTRVEEDPRDPRTAYVTYSGFRQGEDAAYVLRTTDGGASWEDISGELPDAPLNDVNVIPTAGGELLVVAGDVGVFASRNAGRTWLRLGSGLPNAPIHELRWHEPTSTLYVATFGRSMWKVEVPLV